MALALPADPVAAPDADVLLRTTGLTKKYGGVIAMDALDLTLKRGEICGVIGPNGAGKSTLVGVAASRASAAARSSGSIAQLTVTPPADR